MPHKTTLHGSNLPLFRVLASPFLTLQQALTIGDDCWTWSTLSGEIYEDVEIVSLTPTEVTIRHEFGTATIARTDLPREIQQSLIDNSEMAEPDFAREEAPVEKRAISRAFSYSEAA